MLTSRTLKPGHVRDWHKILTNFERLRLLCYRLNDNTEAYGSSQAFNDSRDSYPLEIQPYSRLLIILSLHSPISHWVCEDSRNDQSLFGGFGKFPGRGLTFTSPLGSA